MADVAPTGRASSDGGSVPPGLDTLGFPVEGDIAGVTRAILGGEPVALDAELAWPLPALPPNVTPLAPPDGRPQPGRATVRISDRTCTPSLREVTLRPPSLVVGVGAGSGAPVDEVLELVRESLRAAGLSALCVRELATVADKRDEAGVAGAAARLGVPLVAYPAEELARVDVPHPSGAALAAFGTPSVAEAAALRGGGELLVPKRKSERADGGPARATCAVVRRPARGRLAVVGLGPGDRDLLTPRALDELRRAGVLVGLDACVERIGDLLRPGTRIVASGPGAEEERVRAAVAEARAGRAVALVEPGDAGGRAGHAMASPALAAAGDGIDVVGVPGVSAAAAAAALLGAPLGDDHVSVAWSDAHTPWELVERRVRAAAEVDLVITFHAPHAAFGGQSAALAGDIAQRLPRALRLLSAHLPPTTPVGVVRVGAGPRSDGSVRLTTLAALDPDDVDRTAVVIVGNTATRTEAGRMVTPPGGGHRASSRPEEDE
ncbi:cobalamin biosynthesis protein [Streptomyces typhae]|nr:cobalamin biosynthesis protein [Streptomyces typhae]